MPKTSLSAGARLKADPKNSPKNTLSDAPKIEPNNISGAGSNSKFNNKPSDKLRVIEPVPKVFQPPAWLKYVSPVSSGVKAAFQAFILTFTLLALLVLVTLLADGDNSSWALAFAGATRLWLLAHGAEISFGQLYLVILPLGFTALCLWSLKLCARRSAIRFSAMAGGAIAYALIAAFLARIIGANPAVTSRVTFGASLVGSAGFGWQNLRFLPRYQRFTDQLPVTVYLGLRASRVALLSTFALAAALAAFWALLGLDTTRAVAETLQPGLIGSVVVGVGQLFLLPNWLAWVSGWLVGPGFSLGTGSHYAPASWQGGPLPALPIVSALPPTSWSGPYWQWVPVTVLLIGVLTGLYIWRAFGQFATWRNWLPVAGSTVGACVLAMLVTQWLAGGALGSGRLASIGTTGWLVALIFGAEIGAGIGMVAVGKHFGSRPAKSHRVAEVNQRKARLDQKN
jgi:hypothetical protein